MTQLIVSISAKLIQNPLIDEKIMDQTHIIPSIRQNWPLISKCDLDLGVRGLCIAHEITYNDKHKCQVISKSRDGDEKIMDQTWNIPSIRQCWPLISKCDLGSRGQSVPHDISYYAKLFQIILWWMNNLLSGHKIYPR
jgi:hypothetical protein